MIATIAESDATLLTDPPAVTCAKAPKPTVATPAAKPVGCTREIVPNTSTDVIGRSACDGDAGRHPSSAVASRTTKRRLAGTPPGSPEGRLLCAGISSSPTGH